MARAWACSWRYLATLESREIERLRGAYDKWHHALGADSGSLDAPWHRLVAEHLGELPSGANVLEIACGRGAFAAYLATRGASQVVAADFSPVAVEFTRRMAKERHLEQVEGAVEDIQDLSYDSSSFDVVVSCETVEHVPDPARAVTELARVLKPGGRLLLTTPNYLSLSGAHRAYRRVRGKSTSEVGQPLNNVTFLPRTLLWVRAAGLRVRAVDGSGHYLPRPGREPRALHFLDSIPICRSLGLHSLVVARKPADASETDSEQANA
jgi:2-polyprenyl-3-methyl-5-hydroxy-6-metoxy-1,4-benzoquinol methylase